MTAIDKSQSTIDQLNKYVDSNVLKENMNYTEEDVERLFSEIEYYNEGKDGTNKLEGQIKNLEQRLAELQKRADELQNEIAEIDDKNRVRQEELVKLTALIVEKAAQEALDEALAKYKESGGKGDFNDFYSEAFQSKASELNAHEIIIKNWTSQAESQKTKINDLTGIIQSYLIQTNALKGELNTTCSTISMLTRTKNNMSDTIIGAYKNVDTDTNTPVFSGRKADVANQLLETYQSRYTVTKNETKSDAEKAAEQQELQNKFIGQKQGTFVAETVVDGETKKNDIYNKTSNPELANLGELIEGGMLEELKGAGMSPSDIMSFVNENWQIGLKTPEENNGSWSIPYGHGTSGHKDTNKKFAKDADGTSKIYDALRELFDIDDTEKTKTADSVNQTQMQEMKKAVEQDNILTTMYEAGFTYKEMMYTLSALFPEAGIEYTVSDQNEGQNPANPNDKADSRHYKIVKDSDASGNLYSTISKEILNKWNVGSTEIVEDKPEIPDDKPKDEGFDPMTFIKDGKTFTFIEDRNNNKKFDYKDGNNNDLLGSKDGIYELLQYDYNKDGVIDNKDIVTDENGNKVQMTLVDGSKRDKTALDMLALMTNDQTESIDNSKDIDNYKDAKDYKETGKLTNSVDFDITYTSAYELGIDSIDLKGLNASRDGEKLATGEERFNNDKVYDGFQEEYEDINGSSVINRFGITFKGGESVTANETLNSKENLETFYKQVADRTDINTEKIFSSFDVNTVDNTFIYGKDRTGELNLGAIDNIVKDQITVDGKNMSLGDFVESLDSQIDDMQAMLETKLENSKSADNESLDELLGSIETTLEWIQKQKEEEETPPPPTEPEDNPNPDPPVETKPAEPTPTEPEPTPTVPEPEPEPTPTEPEPEPTPTEPEPEPTPTEPEPEPTPTEPEPEPTPTEPEPEPTPTVPDCEPEDDILPDMFDDTKRKLEE